MRMGWLPLDMHKIMAVYVSSMPCLGVSLQETGEWRCLLEAVSQAWAVRHVDSVHLIIGPCVCIVMSDNGAHGWGMATGNVKVTHNVTDFKGKQGSLCFDKVEIARQFVNISE